MNHMTIAEKTAMLASKEQVDHHTEQSSLNEVDELLKDEKFLVLRNMLAKNDIRTLDQLKNLKLWPFMW